MARVEYVLAQVNIARLRAPLDSPMLAGFVAQLDPVNAAADAAPGFLRRRREWFEHMTETYTALWWIRRGHLPTTGEAEDRVRHLRAHGPTPCAFTLRLHFPPPGETQDAPATGREDWLCPA